MRLKDRFKVTRGLTVGLLVLLTAGAVLAAGCARLAKPEPMGSAPPVIDAYFASPTLYFGQTWKIYVKAHDPDGDMWEARFRIEQPGATYDNLLGDVRLPQSMWQEFNGYFWMHQAVSGTRGGAFDLMLTLEIVDSGGRTSGMVKFPLSVGTKPPASPPEGFNETALLPVPYQPRSDLPMGGGPRPRWEP